MSDTPDLDAIRQRHTKCTRGDAKGNVQGSHCQMCSYVSRGYYVEWPCDAITLLDRQPRGSVGMGQARRPRKEEGLDVPAGAGVANRRRGRD